MPKFTPERIDALVKLGAAVVAVLVAGGMLAAGLATPIVTLWVAAVTAAALFVNPPSGGGKAL